MTSSNITQPHIKEPIMMTKKDISIIIQYDKPLLNTYSNRRAEGKKIIYVTLHKNKKINPDIIYEIYKNHDNLNTSEYHGNVYSRYACNNRKARRINYFPVFYGIVFSIEGSLNGYYDYSLDDLPSDLPIVALHLCLRNYKHNINKLPDSIKKLFIYSGFTNDNYLTTIPKSLKTLSCQCNINLSLLPVTNPNEISLAASCPTFYGANGLPCYFTCCYFYIDKPILSDLPDTMKTLAISCTTKLIHIPLSLEKLDIKINHPQYEQIKTQLQLEKRDHILCKY